MDPPQSRSTSIIMNHVSEDIGEIAKPNSPDISQDQAPTSAVEKDNVFYFETVTFKVEDTLFRVLKSDFEIQGTPFEAIFFLPRASRENVEGTDDSSPIHLHGISKVKFRSFLRVLYPFKGAVTTYDEWIAALDLAIMWDFKVVRKTCIEALSELIISKTDFEKILLAKKYKVKRWLRDGYIQLLQKTQALELGQDICTSKIDAITIARLLYIRERRRYEFQPSNLCHNCSRRANSHFTNFSIDENNRIIDEVFADEIAGMQDDDWWDKKSNTLDNSDFVNFF